GIFRHPHPRDAAFPPDRPERPEHRGARPGRRCRSWAGVCLARLSHRGTWPVCVGRFRRRSAPPCRSIRMPVRMRASGTEAEEPMSELKIYADNDLAEARIYTEGDAIAEALSAIGVLFERWTADAPLSKHATQDEVLAAYRKPVDRLMARYGFQT